MKKKLFGNEPLTRFTDEIFTKYYANFFLLRKIEIFNLFFFLNWSSSLSPFITVSLYANQFYLLYATFI